MIKRALVSLVLIAFTSSLALGSDSDPDEDTTSSYVVNKLKELSAFGAVGDSSNRIIDYVHFRYHKPFLLLEHKYHFGESDHALDIQDYVDLRKRLNINSNSDHVYINCYDWSHCIKETTFEYRDDVLVDQKTTYTPETDNFLLNADSDSVKRLVNAILHLSKFQTVTPQMFDQP